MNLVLDLGNTQAKATIFKDDQIIESKSFHNNTGLRDTDIIFIAEQFQEIDQVILSSVVNHSSEFEVFLKKTFDFCIVLSTETNLPITNHYKSKTLGNDRIAAVVGANNIFPDQNVLVIDSGSAITFDFINSGRQYLGGNISPGLEMRFRALNQFTQRLPKLSKKDGFLLLADNTEDAIIFGVQNGVIFEIDSYITNLNEKYKDLKVIMTGGDAFFFEKKIKSSIFVEPNIVQLGLNIILNYNERNN
jgi:type III pantothenate kinase